MASDDYVWFPTRVEAAFRYLAYTRDAESPDNTLSARELNERESKTKDIALRLLQQYLSCEMDFGDVSPFHFEDDDGPEEKEPALVQ